MKFNDLGSTVNRAILHTLVLAGLVVTNSGCQKTIKTDEPIRVVPVTSLNVKLGDEVTWTFKAYRGSREVVVLEALPGDMPLGVIRKFDAKVPTISGKVLTRDVRQGLIRVMAFDEAACKQAYEAMKKTTAEQVEKTKDTNVSIPVSPCNTVTVSPMSTPPEFLSYGYFAWHMVDGPDLVLSQDYGKFFAQNFAVAGKNMAKLNFVSIPEQEAPHTVDVWLGSCAAKERRFCGASPDCLWGRVSCLSKEATGASAIKDEDQKGKI